MMNEIIFGEYKSYTDLGLILTQKKLGTPKIKEYKIDIVGGDGELDYTEYFGGTKYENLKHSFDFKTLKQPFLEQYSRIKDLLHGQKMRITLEEDSEFYYIGRLAVSAFSTDGNIGIISIECNCEPYKYKQNITVVAQAVSGSAVINLSNMRKKVVPTITTTAEMTFAFNDISTIKSSGVFKIPELELVEGDNIVTITGEGNVVFEYQEGGF